MSALRRIATYGFALLLACAAMAVGVWLLRSLSSAQSEASPEEGLRMVQMDFTPPPPPKKRRPKKQTETRRIETRTPAVPLPNLPSAIRAHSLAAPDLDVAGLIRPLEEEDVGQSARLVMSEEMVDEPPRLLRRIPPEYPAAAADAGVEGDVVLRLLVNRDGRVEQVKIDSADPPGTFDDAARMAAVRWRFSPAVFESQKVAAWCRNRLRFRLAQ